MVLGERRDFEIELDIIPKAKHLRGDAAESHLRGDELLAGVRTAVPVIQPLSGNNPDIPPEILRDTRTGLGDKALLALFAGFQFEDLVDLLQHRLEIQLKVSLGEADLAGDSREDTDNDR